MTKSFISTDPNTHQSENTWFTPKTFIEALGPFDLDPCTVSTRPFDTASTHYCSDHGQDGLELPWSGDVWLNPPYGKEILPFVYKFIQHKKGCMLIFSRTGAPYFQGVIKAQASVFLLRKRVAFIDKTGAKRSNAGADSCIVFFDNKYAQRIQDNFDGVFIKGQG